MSRYSDSLHSWLSIDLQQTSTRQSGLKQWKLLICSWMSSLNEACLKTARSLPWATSAGQLFWGWKRGLSHKTEELVSGSLVDAWPAYAWDLLQMGHSMGSLNGAVWPSSQHSSQVPRDKGESFKITWLLSPSVD